MPYDRFTQKPTARNKILVRPLLNVGPIKTPRAQGEVTSRVFASPRSVLNFRWVMDSGLWYTTKSIELLRTLHELSTQKPKAQKTVG